MRFILPLMACVCALAVAPPLAAKDSLGVFGNWGAFRDEREGRCYAIAMPEERRGRRDFNAFASVGTWPKDGVRGQVQFRTSLALPSNSRVTLIVGEERFTLTGGGSDVWAANASQDATIRTAMRSASRMELRGRDTRGADFVDRYSLSGVATAMDAATVGCSQR